MVRSNAEVDPWKLNGCKLMWHPRLLAEWFEGKNPYPVYVEISPSGRCNQRCIFCSFDYMGYKGGFISTRDLENCLCELSDGGTKSIMFAGEGEPFLHPDLPELIQFAKSWKLDIAITTNGTKIPRDLDFLKALSWIRFSINAGSPSTYGHIHGCSPLLCREVWNNLYSMVQYKKRNDSKCTIGVQTVLLEENKDEIQQIAVMAKEAGADYYSVKPFTAHPLRVNKSPDYSQITISKLISDDKFKVIIRETAIKNLGRKREYSECYGLDFFCYIDHNGEVWPCSNFLGVEGMSHGNIKNGFDNLWNNRGQVKRQIKLSDCREICRLDEINKYLWQLKENRPEHLNFV